MTPKRVLIVDDEPDLARLLAFNVARLGCETQRVGTGLGALELVVSFQPQVVLLDWGLPDVSGLEVCRRIKTDAASRHIAVVMVTAYDRSSARDEGLRAGASAYVTKPFRVCDVVERVRALLGP